MQCPAHNLKSLFLLNKDKDGERKQARLSESIGKKTREEIIQKIKKARRQSLENMPGLIAGREVELLKLPKEYADILSSKSYSEESSSEETKSIYKKSPDNGRITEMPIFEEADGLKRVQRRKISNIESKQASSTIFSK